MHILSLPECNILANLDSHEQEAIKVYIRHLILATDLALHGMLLALVLPHSPLLAAFSCSHSLARLLSIISFNLFLIAVYLFQSLALVLGYSIVLFP